jgi:hypothetical protein
MVESVVDGGMDIKKWLYLTVPLGALTPSSRLGGSGGLLAEQRVGGLLLHIR